MIEKYARASTTTVLTMRAFTLGRLVLVPVLIASFMHEPWMTAFALALFIAADVYDGVLARRFDADDVERRALDSTVDRLAIDACLVGAWAVGSLPAGLLLAFLARDLYCALLCAAMVRRRQVAIKADWVYRSLNLSVAAWAIATPLVSASTATALAVALLVASLCVAADLTRLVRRVFAAGSELGHRVIPAQQIRDPRF